MSSLEERLDVFEWVFLPKNIDCWICPSLLRTFWDDDVTSGLVREGIEAAGGVVEANVFKKQRW